MAIKVIVAGLGPRAAIGCEKSDRLAAFELAACVDTDGQVLLKLPTDLKIPRH